MKKFINPEIEVVELHKSFQINTAYADVTGGGFGCGDYDKDCDCDWKGGNPTLEMLMESGWL